MYPSRIDNLINWLFIPELKKQYTIINSTNAAIDSCPRDHHEINSSIFGKVAAFICPLPKGSNIPELDIFKIRYIIGDIPTKTNGKLNKALTKKDILIFLWKIRNKTTLPKRKPYTIKLSKCENPIRIIQSENLQIKVISIFFESNSSLLTKKIGKIKIFTRFASS